MVPLGQTASQSILDAVSLSSGPPEEVEPDEVVSDDVDDAVVDDAVDESVADVGPSSPG